MPMQVATRLPNPPPVEKTPESFVKIEPSPTSAMAMISTAWGTCAIVWKNPDDGHPSAFVERPPSALLCRILTPGLSPSLATPTRNPPSASRLPGGHGSGAQLLPSRTCARVVWRICRVSRGVLQLPPARSWVNPDSNELGILEATIRLESVDRVSTPCAGSGRGNPQWCPDDIRPGGRPHRQAAHASRAVGAAVGRNPWPRAGPLPPRAGAGWATDRVLRARRHRNQTPHVGTRTGESIIPLMRRCPTHAGLK